MFIGFQHFVFINYFVNQYKIIGRIIKFIKYIYQIIKVNEIVLLKIKIILC